MAASLPTLMAALLGHAARTPRATGRAAAALPHRAAHHLPPLRPPVGPPPPVPALGTGRADQHALDPAPTLTWVERNFGYAATKAYAGHTDNGSDTGATATYVRATTHEVAAALAALTGEPHPLAMQEGVVTAMAALAASIDRHGATADLKLGAPGPLPGPPDQPDGTSPPWSPLAPGPSGPGRCWSCAPAAAEVFSGGHPGCCMTLHRATRRLVLRRISSGVVLVAGRCSRRAGERGSRGAGVHGAAAVRGAVLDGAG